MRKGRIVYIIITALLCCFLVGCSDLFKFGGLGGLGGNNGSEEENNNGISEFKKEYTVSFDSVGGSYVQSQIVKNGEYAVRPANPTRAGYVFAGWYSNGDLWDFETRAVTKDIKLVALWNQDDGSQIVITLNVNGGDPLSTTTIYVEDGGQYTLPSPTRNGYDFVGWFAGGKQYSGGTFKGSSNLELTAKWVTASYKVIIKYNDDVTEDTIVYRTYGSKLNNLPTPQREGYRFDGWVEDLPSTMPANDIVLTAKWVTGSATLTVIYDDGVTPDLVITLPYGSVIPTIDIPERDGFEFMFFSQVIPEKMPSYDMTVYARWRELTNVAVINYYDLDGNLIKTRQCERYYSYYPEIPEIDYPCYYCDENGRIIHSSELFINELVTNVYCIKANHDLLADDITINGGISVKRQVYVENLNMNENSLIIRTTEDLTGYTTLNLAVVGVNGGQFNISIHGNSWQTISFNSGQEVTKSFNIIRSDKEFFVEFILEPLNKCSQFTITKLELTGSGKIPYDLLRGEIYSYDKMLKYNRQLVISSDKNDSTSYFTINSNYNYDSYVNINYSLLELQENSSLKLEFGRQRTISDYEGTIDVSDVTRSNLNSIKVTPTIKAGETIIISELEIETKHDRSTHQVDLSDCLIVEQDGVTVSRQLTICKTALGDEVNVFVSNDLTGYTQLEGEVFGTFLENVDIQINGKSSSENNTIVATTIAQKFSYDFDFLLDNSKPVITLYPNRTLSGEGNSFTFTKLVLKGEGKEPIDLLYGTIIDGNGAHSSCELVIEFGGGKEYQYATILIDENLFDYSCVETLISSNSKGHLSIDINTLNGTGTYLNNNSENMTMENYVPFRWVNEQGLISVRISTNTYEHLDKVVIHSIELKSVDDYRVPEIYLNPEFEDKMYNEGIVFRPGTNLEQELFKDGGVFENIAAIDVVEGLLPIEVDYGKIYADIHNIPEGHYYIVFTATNSLGNVAAYHLELIVENEAVFEEATVFEGTYLLSVYRSDLDTRIYGIWPDGYYLCATGRKDQIEYFDIYPIEGKENEYYIRHDKGYLEIYESDFYGVGIQYVSEPTGVWKYNDIVKTFTYTLTGCQNTANNGTYFIGASVDSNKYLLPVINIKEVTGKNANNLDSKYFPIKAGLIAGFEQPINFEESFTKALNGVDLVNCQMEVDEGINVSAQIRAVKYEGNDWDCFGLKVNKNFDGYTKIAITIKGKEGKQILFKLNDQHEYFINLDGAKQDIILDIPSNFIWDLNRITMLIFVDPATSGSGQMVTIEKMQLQGTNKQSIDLLMGELVNTNDNVFVVRDLVVTKEKGNTNPNAKVRVYLDDEVKDHSGLRYYYYFESEDDLSYSMDISESYGMNGNIINRYAECKCLKEYFDSSKDNLTIDIFPETTDVALGARFVITPICYFDYEYEKESIIGHSLAGMQSVEYKFQFRVSKSPTVKEGYASFGTFLNLEGYNIIIVEIVGTEGEEIIFRPDNNPDYEQVYTMTGNQMTINIKLPDDFQWNPGNSDNRLVILPNGNQFGSGNLFKINGLVLTNRNDFIHLLDRSDVTVINNNLEMCSRGIALWKTKATNVVEGIRVYLNKDLSKYVGIRCYVQAEEATDFGISLNGKTGISGFLGNSYSPLSLFYSGDQIVNDNYIDLEPLTLNSEFFIGEIEYVSEK